MCEGALLRVEYEGVSFDVLVPPGVHAGATFAVEIAGATEPDQEYELEPADPEPERASSAAPVQEEIEFELEPPTISKPAAVPGAGEGLSLLMAAVAERRLSPDNAQALHDIMEALYDFGALNRHAPCAPARRPRSLSRQ